MCTKHRQAPKKKTEKQKFQQLLTSGPIVLEILFFCFFWYLAGFGDSRLCMFGSGPYFKLLFQRSKHTIIFEQLCHHTDCLILLVNSMTHFSVSLAFSLSLTIEMRLLTRLCKITMINKICTYFLSCNIPTILLIQSVRCACVYPPT